MNKISAVHILFILSATLINLRHYFDITASGSIPFSAKTYAPSVASVPLIVLGALRGQNTVGVTQALDVLYHAPAPL